MRTLRELFRKLPDDGSLRHALRQFNLSQARGGKAKSVKKLAESLGFDVRRVPLPKGMSGRLVQDPFSENGFAIEVSNTQSVQANRFAVLHEMGHYYLGHVDRSDPLADAMHFDPSRMTFYVDVTQEQEANEFADVVLFGDSALVAAESLLGRDIARLSKLFGVSERVLEIALRKHC